MLQAQVEKHRLMKCIASVQVEQQLHVVGVDTGPHVMDNIPSCLCCREGMGLHVSQCRQCCKGPGMALQPNYCCLENHKGTSRTLQSWGGLQGAETQFGGTPVLSGTCTKWS